MDSGSMVLIVAGVIFYGIMIAIMVMVPGHYKKQAMSYRRKQGNLVEKIPSEVMEYYFNILYESKDGASGMRLPGYSYVSNEIMRGGITQMRTVLNISGKKLVKYCDYRALKKHLIAICDKLNVDFSTTGLGSYNGQASTWYGWGLGGIAVATVLSLNSVSKNNRKKDYYESVSIMCSYQTIAGYFNSVHYPDEYKPPVEKIDLSGKF